MPKTESTYRRAIVWFRRDLRVADNLSLHNACQKSDEVIPTYIISDWKKQHDWIGPNRQSFLCGCLDSLSNNIQSLGGHLIFRQGNAVNELESLLEETGADALFYSRDPDPFGRESETKIRALCKRRGVEVHDYLDCAIHEPDAALTGSGTPYRVFTPFSKTWLNLEKPPPVKKPKRIPTPDGISSLAPPTNAIWKIDEPTAEIIEPGERAARKRLDTFVSKMVGDYKKLRDSPSAEATSRLGQDLRHGTISARQVYAACQKAAATSSTHSEIGIRTYLSEIAWREFYFSIIHHFPEILEHEFNPDYRGLTWGNDEHLLAAWKNGETGFPIVDAGMRQLAKTGFMHNRVRMIVSMFLTKDLHLDWRLGEKHFMQLLTDGEIASNNGGWQWSAGTGADAAPYFRIQNPWSQTKSHDPKGDYIKKWIPELADVDPKKFTTPPDDGKPLAKGYPAPIVDHAEERQRTLEMFKAYRAK